MSRTVALEQLLDLLGSGCQSEMEIWGFLHVFNHPSLPPATRQHRVALPSRVVYLDMAYLDEQVAVELDGSRSHVAHREWDVRRDAELATLGWLTVRVAP